MSNIPEYSVSELSLLIKKKLEEGFDHIQIKGEISDIKLWNGHYLFNLKDDGALIAARIWKNRVPFLNFKPEEGLEINATGKISTHQKRSGYNLIIENINAAGEGALLKLIETRKKNLKEKGVFDKSTTLPFLPEKIGIITSLTGAVIEDIKNKISLKFPSYLLLWPITVQGPSAVNDIVEAIRGFNLKTKNIPDVIILARGGGSVEDLMAFNAEEVAYAIYNSRIPIISAVGHETDFTIADFAADHRASTPTAAADLVVPNKREIAEKINTLSKACKSLTVKYILNHYNQMKQIYLRINSPKRIIVYMQNVLKKNTLDLDKLMKILFISKSNKINTQILKNPNFILKNGEKNLLRSKKNINYSILKVLKLKNEKLKNQLKILLSSSYERLLQRGFSIVRNKDNKLIKDLTKVDINEEIKINFLRGEVNAKIKKIKHN